MFSISSENLDRDDLHTKLSNDKAGAIVVFEGWVRDHNEGKTVSSLEYQVYKELALKEGEKILQEAREKFNLHGVLSVHREGHLKLGEIAIWIGATASHRDDAFKATRYIIDEIKHRLPVWKKEHYVDHKADWVFCRHHSHHVHFEEADFYKKQVKIVNQNKLKNAKVLVIGAGGLGHPALMALASAGVGTIGIMDFDKIDITNIHRQPLFSPNLVGEKKAVIAAVRLQELNPFIQINTHQTRLDAAHGEEILRDYELILDCTDNMQTKFLIHDLCFKLRLPLISASVYKEEGQIRTFKSGSDEGCLRCHSKMTPDDSLLGNCNDFGVLGATTQVLGSLQASEAIHFLNEGKNATLAKTLFMNLKTLFQIQVKNTKHPECSVCQGQVEIKINDFEVGIEECDGSFMVLDIRELDDEHIHQFASSDKKIALCCHRGVRSKKLAETFRASGHQQFYSLKGGAAHL